MSELQFAKTFLSGLESRPSKISLDHYEDPRTYPARTAYILPKNPKPLQKRKRAVPGEEQTYTITLKSARNPPLNISLPSRPTSTSILALKQEVAEQASVPISAIRILYKKKPVPDSKVVKDLVGDDEVGAGEVEFGIMVIGGAAVVGTASGAGTPVGAGTPRAEEEQGDPMVLDAPVAQGPSGKDVVESEEFWGDLKGFLLQRLRDEAEGERLYALFKGAYAESR